MSQILIFLDLQLTEKHLDSTIKKLNRSINILFLLKAFIKVRIYFYDANKGIIDKAEFTESNLYIDKLKEIFTCLSSVGHSIPFTKKLRALIFELNKQKVQNKEILILTNSSAHNNEALISNHKLFSILYKEKIASLIHIFLLGVNHHTIELLKETIGNSEKGSLNFSNNLSSLKHFFLRVSCCMLKESCFVKNTEVAEISSVKYYCSEHPTETLKKGIMCTLCGAVYCKLRGKCAICATRIAPDLIN